MSTPTLADKPKLSELDNFYTSTGDTIKIIKQIAAEYNLLGTQLLKDEDGAITAAIAREHNRNADEINREILRRWLQGQGRKPVNWSTLIDVLRKIGRSELADKIQKSLTSSGDNDTGSRAPRDGTGSGPGKDDTDGPGRVPRDGTGSGPGKDDTDGRSRVPGPMDDPDSGPDHETSSVMETVALVAVSLAVVLLVYILLGNWAAGIALALALCGLSTFLWWKWRDIPRRDFKLDSVQGLAVLVTCDYDGELDTKKDAIEMRKTFEHFGYKIVELKNNKATYGEITKLMKQISQYLSEYNGPIDNKVLIFAFSGHGASRDRITPYGRCARKLSLRKDILPHFVKNINLYEIPKLFFIDACRGGGEIKGENDSFQMYWKEYVPKGLKENEGNFRIDFATIPGHLAYVNSWMCHLAEDIRNKSPQKSIQEIAVTVRSKVTDYQIPEAIDRLSDVFYFRR